LSPEGLKPAVVAGSDQAADSTTVSNAVIGPVLPPGFKPSAPKDTGSSTEDSNTSSNEDSRDLYGPLLPPGFGKPEIIGPALPPGFASSSSSSSSQSFIGPAMPPGFGKTAQADQEVPEEDDGDSSDSYIGPKPSEAVGEDYTGNEAALDFERRATKMKRHLEEKDQDDEPRREEWMTELPDNLGLRIGLGPRTFRKNMEDPKADRSGWTDSPADKAKKAEVKKTKKNEAAPSSHLKRSKKEEEIAEQLTKYNKEKRAESLLDMHRKKRKVEQSKVVVQERKEFNREEDLKISRIDAKANKALLNKAALLNTKFAAGAQKFL
ncbi:unnamed protein product, partial [Ixodes hexagonus]